VFQAKDLLPDMQLADTGYVAADQIVLSQNTYGIELVGPPRADYHWQAHAAQGFAAQDFKVDWDAQQLTCPQGHLSNNWTPAQSCSGLPVIKVKFSSTGLSGLPVPHQLHEEHHPPTTSHRDLANARALCRLTSRAPA
jgi:transposase